MNTDTDGKSCNGWRVNTETYIEHYDGAVTCKNCLNKMGPPDQ